MSLMIGLLIFSIGLATLYRCRISDRAEKKAGVFFWGVWMVLLGIVMGLNQYMEVI